MRYAVNKTILTLGLRSLSLSCSLFRTLSFALSLSQLKQFEDVNIYLNSVKAYMYNDDDFNHNYGISLAQTGNFKEAEETLLLVQVRISELTQYLCCCCCCCWIIGSLDHWIIGDWGMLHLTH